MSARYHLTGQALSTAYVTLFQGANAGGSDGADMWGLEIWATAGTATVKVNGNIIRTIGSGDTAHSFKFSKGTSDTINKVEAIGVPSATVLWCECM